MTNPATILQGSIRKQDKKIPFNSGSWWNSLPPALAHSRACFKENTLQEIWWTFQLCLLFSILLHPNWAWIFHLKQHTSANPHTEHLIFPRRTNFLSEIPSDIHNFWYTGIFSMYSTYRRSFHKPYPQYITVCVKKFPLKSVFKPQPDIKMFW